MTRAVRPCRCCNKLFPVVGDGRDSEGGADARVQAGEEKGSGQALGPSATFGERLLEMPDEEEEVRDVDKLPAPDAPTKAEAERHRISHLPYRA